MTEPRPRSGKGKFRRTAKGTENARQALVRYAEGATYAEIGRELGMTRQSAKQAVERGQEMAFAGASGTVEQLREELLRQRADAHERLIATAVSPPDVVSAGKLIEGVPDKMIATRAEEAAEKIRQGTERLAGLAGKGGPTVLPPAEVIEMAWNDRHEEADRILAAGHCLLAHDGSQGGYIHPRGSYVSHPDPDHVVDAEVIEDGPDAA